MADTANRSKRMLAKQTKTNKQTENPNTKKPSPFLAKNTRKTKLATQKSFGAGGKREVRQEVTDSYVRDKEILLKRIPR